LERHLVLLAHVGWHRVDAVVLLAVEDDLQAHGPRYGAADGRSKGVGVTFSHHPQSEATRCASRFTSRPSRCSPPSPPPPPPQRRRPEKPPPPTATAASTSPGPPPARPRPAPGP